jgi:hypothetical protein
VGSAGCGTSNSSLIVFAIDAEHCGAYHCLYP